MRFKRKRILRQLRKFKECLIIDQHVIEFKQKKPNASRTGQYGVVGKLRKLKGLRRKTA